MCTCCGCWWSGGAGMDVVSGGELHRAELAGADVSKVVYAGAGKTDAEIEQALEAGGGGIGLFNIESEAEFENIARRSRGRAGRTAHAALRINPDVDPETAHAKTTTGQARSRSSAWTLSGPGRFSSGTGGTSA